MTVICSIISADPSLITDINNNIIDIHHFNDKDAGENELAIQQAFEEKQAEVFEKLTDETAPQGIFSVIKKRRHIQFSESSLADGGFIILEDIQNPQNLGAIFRCKMAGQA